MLIKTYGKISEETFLAQLPFIESPADEIIRLDKEREELDKRLIARGEVDLDKGTPNELP